MKISYPYSDDLFVVSLDGKPIPITKTKANGVYTNHPGLVTSLKELKTRHIPKIRFRTPWNSDGTALLFDMLSNNVGVL